MKEPEKETRKSREKVTLLFMYMNLVFTVCLIASNILETKQMVFGPLHLTGGLLIFPISYIINDVVCEVWGLTPRIALASFVSFLAGSFVNAYVMSRMKIADKGRRFPLRAIVSTIFGEGADSLLFFPLAFYGVLPNAELPLMMLSQLVLKTVYEVIVLPVTIRVVAWVKAHEGEDVYDNGISYGILDIFKKNG